MLSRISRLGVRIFSEARVGQYSVTQRIYEHPGACEGSLACSTCHAIVMDVEDYNKLGDPTDEGNDMLDLAFGLTETSRLGCQVIAKPELDGIHLSITGSYTELCC